MPYSVRKHGSGYAVYKKERGKWQISSRHKSKALAESSRKLKEGIHRGWKPTRKNK